MMFACILFIGKNVFKFFFFLQETGTFGCQRLVVLASQDAHYSIKKAAFLLGVGSANVYRVNVDQQGRMDLNHLREEINRAIRENARPFMVSATAGNNL